MSSQIKSKKRVRDHGEVFTQEREVNAMIDLVRNEVERIESRFLEPACGDGNFLAPILKRKLEVVRSRYKSSQTEFEKMAFLAVSSIYGVELLQDNVKACIERLFNITENIYSKLYKNKCKDEFKNSIRFVLERNILHGDALTLKNADNSGYIVFSEWSFVKSNLIKRKDFRYIELADFNQNESSLFSSQEVSDIGEKVFLPSPIEEFPLMHYLKLKYEDAK